METLIIGVAAVLAVVLASQAAPKVRVASPLILVVVGIAVSLLPFVPAVEVEPEWILAGVLPPLLYSSAVGMPTMDFRRDFGAISGLSVVLVVISTGVVGVLFYWLIPGLGLPAAIALGAIVSPTDAVATTIVKRLGVPPRIVAVLEGEGLLNDASALVLLRTAIVAGAATVSFWGILGQFAYSVALAVAIGLAIGWVNLRVRSKITDVAAATAISFTVPFLASIPAELLGASGLVAAVTAGLVTGNGAAKWLTPTQRFSDTRNWRTIELLLEGGVFLVMGLELYGVLTDLDEASSIWKIGGLALLAVVLTIAVRAAFVAPLLRMLRRRAERSVERKDGIAAMQERIDKVVANGPEEHTKGRQPGEVRFTRPVRPEDAERFRDRAVRFIADVEYMEAEPLGVKEGALVVWAGMRGVVTLAAAQTLPEDTPFRSDLVLIAFFVAAFSLLIQGGTLAMVARWLGLTGIGVDVEERKRLSKELRKPVADVLAAHGHDKDSLLGLGKRALTAGTNDSGPDAADGSGEIAAEGPEEDIDAEMEEVPNPSPDYDKVLALRIEMLHAQRDRLLELKQAGTYSSGALDWALTSIDADEISIELHAPDAGEE